MRITAVRAWLVSIPLAAPYVISRGSLDRFTNVVVRVDTDAGLSGFGEAVPVSLLGDPREYARIIETLYAPALLGRDPREIEPIVDALLTMPGSTAAVAGIDLALWDIAASSLGAPVSALLGGAGVAAVAAVAVDYTMSVDAPEAMVATARAVTAAGFRGVVVKVACRDVAADVACVRAVRAALPAGSSLRVDCNGGYGRDDALAFLAAIDGLAVEFVEQPVAAADLEGMALCRGRGVAIAADESLSTPADALALLQHRACDVMNVKVPKAGGLLQAKRVAAIAAAAGLPLVVGGGLTFGISRFASQHLAASSTAAQGRCHQGPGPASQALTDDITTPRVTRAVVSAHAGCVPVPTGPGLGFTVDEAKLAAYAA
ncbi:mandelate racemase/muconate lactonizing enzyme family protein [Roseomonas elaeocarpi]|uniref:Mandelate racemase/muconate lactonizing enzyme family protein n=1 Tax=Roseomonas elaeocarpi TaxID=907779 RepID=A0ABV6JN62_9PROT